MDRTFPDSRSPGEELMLTIAADHFFDDFPGRLSVPGFFFHPLFSEAADEARPEPQSPGSAGPDEATFRRRPRPRRHKAKKGEVLIVSDDLNLVLAMREDLLEAGYDLTWTNNFWIAMSYMRSRVFSSLVLDMTLGSVEERFVLHFLEEYEERSGGQKIFLADEQVPQALRRQLEERGHGVCETELPPEDLVRRLRLHHDEPQDPRSGSGRRRR